MSTNQNHFAIINNDFNNKLTKFQLLDVLRGLVEHTKPMSDYMLLCVRII